VAPALAHELSAHAFAAAFHEECASEHAQLAEPPAGAEPAPQAAQAGAPAAAKAAPVQAVHELAPGVAESCAKPPRHWHTAAAEAEQAESCVCVAASQATQALATQAPPAPSVKPAAQPGPGPIAAGLGLELGVLAPPPPPPLWQMALDVAVQVWLAPLAQTAQSAQGQAPVADQDTPVTQASATQAPPAPRVKPTAHPGPGPPQTVSDAAVQVLPPTPVPGQTAQSAQGQVPVADQDVPPTQASATQADAVTLSAPTVAVSE
jgi:hypothetical protein